ncbi:MAG: beta-lactamase family protein, partial [Flavobacteriaceae bacterium]|nr:beta-lactamase family protein [Flavobacteriaceae bacterium]
FKYWLKENIFDKLGMNHTYVEDQYDRVALNNATSYGGNSEFKRKIEYWNYVGSGNMHSTTSDLLKWLQNFSSPQKNWESAFATLLTTDPLNNGTPNLFGFGVRIENHLGKKIIQHGGSIGGFRSTIRAYPEDNLNIVVLTNFTGSNIMSKTNRIAEIIYPIKENNTPQKQVQLTKQPKKFIKLSNKKLAEFEGIYWNNKEKYGRKIYVRNDTLRYSRSKTNESPLMPIKKNIFKMLNVDVDLTVEFKSNADANQMIVVVEQELPLFFDLHKITKKSRAEELAEYSGKYYSSEIETAYTISIEGTEIYIHHIRHGKIKLKRLYQDILEGEWPINLVEIKRSNTGIIDGIQITNGRVRNLWFKKML